MNRTATHQALSGRYAIVLRWLTSNWLIWFSFLTGVWVVLPWLAPVFMHMGFSGAAWFIYLIYSPQCHQLPQRSFFLFGDQLMVPVEQILAVTNVQDPLTLRWFNGTPQLGWKVAWSDRMVWLYTPLFIGALFYGLVGRHWQPVQWHWKLLLPYLPLFIDGSTHMLDDTFQLGFRTTNEWLVLLTNGILAPQFYAGDLIGSFNWWMRLLTGLVAGFAFVRQIYPHLNRGFVAMERSV